MRAREIRCYDSFEDDFEQTAEQDKTLPKCYRRLRRDARFRLLSGVIYAAAYVIGSVYCRLVLHVRLHGTHKLRSTRGGCFVYGNHTQPFGDVFIPALCASPRRIYTVVSPANFGIPVIGRLLPYLGALPTADTLSGLRDLEAAISARADDGHPIVIYPEAHVWKYYNKIRPFSDTSFRYPARLTKPAFAMTVVYRKRRFGRRPAAEVYIDGPFYAEGEGIRSRSASLHNAVSKAMNERCAMSDAEFIIYRKK